MAGCGRCPEPRTATRTAAAEPSRGVRRRFRRRPTQRRGVRGGRTPTAPHVRLAEPSSSVCPLTGQPARLPDTTTDAPPRNAAAVAGRRAAPVRTPTGDAARVADTYCTGGHRTGRCPLAERPADMTVEAAAEGRSDSAQAAVMAPVAGHPTAARHTLPGHPSAHRTTWPHRTGRAKQRTVNPPIALARSIGKDPLDWRRDAMARGRPPRPRRPDQPDRARIQEGS